jgi:hypothetical protein
LLAFFSYYSFYFVTGIWLVSKIQQKMNRLLVSDEGVYYAYVTKFNNVAVSDWALDHLSIYGSNYWITSSLLILPAAILNFFQLDALVSLRITAFIFGFFTFYLVLQSTKNYKRRNFFIVVISILFFPSANLIRLFGIKDIVISFFLTTVSYFILNNKNSGKSKSQISYQRNFDLKIFSLVFLFIFIQPLIGIVLYILFSFKSLLIFRIKETTYSFIFLFFYLVLYFQIINNRSTLYTDGNFDFSTFVENRLSLNSYGDNSFIGGNNLTFLETSKFGHLIYFDTSSLFSTLITIESICWFILILTCLWNLKNSFTLKLYRKSNELFVFLILLTLYTLFLIYDDNMGTFLRHRSILLFPFFLLIFQLREKKSYST